MERALMSAPLYIQAADVASILSAVDAAEGEWTPELEEAFGERYESLTDKVAALLAYMREERSRVDAADEEIRRITRYRDSHKSRVEWAKGYLIRCLTVAGIDSVDAGTMGRVKVQQGKARVEVVDVEALPPGLVRTVRSADKRLVKAALEAGEEVPGARLVTGDPWVRIT